MNIGIVGIKGKFGQWLERFFHGLDYNVFGSDIGTKLTNQKVVEKADVVIFAVPISETVAVIEEVIPCSRKEQLWMDVTSLKVAPIEAMLKSMANVIGMHPMFKPSLPSIKQQVVVLCHARATEQWLEWIQGILEENGAKVKIMAPKQHDKMMSIIQGGTHIPLIAAGHAYSLLGLNIAESLEVASPIYRLRLEMIGRVLGGNPRLYAEIAMLNPDALRSVSNLLVSVQKLLDIMISGDIEAFIAFFEEAADFFGDFKDEAIAHTDHLIQQMIK